MGPVTGSSKSLTYRVSLLFSLAEQEPHLPHSSIYRKQASNQPSDTKTKTQPSNSMMGPNSTRDIISWHAYVSGIKAGSVAGMVAGAGVLSANKYWPAFRTRLGVSGKTALVVMPALAAFTIVSENRMLAGARNPQQYLASMDSNFVELQLPKQSSLKLYQRAANYWYDHPYRVLAGVGVPLVGGIFASQSLNTSIQRSQQIMHTRIYGQSAVVALLLGSMAFSDFMKTRGHFEETETGDS